MDSLRRSANKYAVLEDYEEDERHELNTLKDREIVDVYLNKKLRLTDEVARTWSKDMMQYFNTQWEVDRNKEKEYHVIEKEEVLENDSETGNLLLTNEMQGKDKGVLH